MTNPHPTYTPTSILNTFYSAERIYTTTPTPETLKSLLSTLSPTITLLQTPSLPYSGTYTGHSGFTSCFTKMSTHFSLIDVQNPTIFTNNTCNKIIVNSTVKFIVRKTGKELSYPFCQVVGVDVERGVITEMVPFYWDVAGLLRVLEGEE